MSDPQPPLIQTPLDSGPHCERPAFPVFFGSLIVAIQKGGAVVCPQPAKLRL